MTQLSLTLGAPRRVDRLFLWLRADRPGGSRFRVADLPNSLRRDIGLPPLPPGAGSCETENASDV